MIQGGDFTQGNGMGGESIYVRLKLNEILAAYLIYVFV
jgi:hypothetical protein